MNGGNDVFACTGGEIKSFSRKRKTMNPLTLAFSEGELERDFRKDYFGKSLRRTRYAVILGIFIYAALGCLDGWIIPDAKSQAWFIRYVVVCPFLAVLFFFTYTSFYRKFTQLAMFLGIFIAGEGVISMIAFSEPPGNYLYYAGLLLVIMFAYMVVPLRFVYASAVSWALVGAYAITYLWNRDVPLTVFINNSVFFIAASIVGMLGAYLMELQVRKNFLHVRTLREVLRQLGAEIEERKRKEAVLRESEEKYHTLINDAGEAIVIIGLEGELLEVNRKLEEISGYSREELLSKNLREFFPQEETGRVDEVFREGIKNGSGSIRDVLMLRKRGRAIPIEATGSIIEYAGKKVAQVIVRDITVRKSMEEKLTQYQNYLEKLVSRRTAKLNDLLDSVRREISEREGVEKRLMAAKEQLESFIGNSADAIVIIDTEGTILTVNAAFESLYGWSSEELVGGRLPVIPPDLESEFEGFRRRIVEKGTVCRYETVRRRKDGGTVNVSVTLSPVYEQGKVVAIAGITRDMTWRKKTEEAVIESERKFRSLSLQFHTLLDSIPDVIILLSPDLRLLWSNISGTLALDRDVSSMVGRHCYELWFKSEQPCEGCNVLKSFTTGQMESGRVISLGGRFWESRAIPLKGADGGVTSAVVIRRDVTEKIRLQEEAMRSAHLASLGELAAGVAHEINNPINGIINYAQLLLNDSKPQSDGSDIGGRIIREGMRIANIVGNLLSFAREKTDEKVAVHLRDVMTDSFALIDTKLKRDGIRLVVDIPEDLPAVLANRQQMEQVFLNILHNAQYALNQKYPLLCEDKTIDIVGERVNVNGAVHARITFLDRGTGIAANVLGKVVDPFFTTKPPGAGTGLGLSLSHGIISNHRGKLTIDSVEGEFAMVVVELPAMEER
jgi:PAS domain S-box-containing protein